MKVSRFKELLVFLLVTSFFNSINSILLEDFLKIYNLKNKKINYINEDQAYISKLNSKNLKNPTIVVTYTPYNYDLEKNGFNELSSTKNNSNLLVIDAMFTNEDFFNENKNATTSHNNRIRPYKTLYFIRF